MPQPEQRFLGIGALAATGSNIVEIVPARPRNIEVIEITVQGTSIPSVVLSVAVQRGNNQYSPLWLLGNGTLVDAGFFLDAGTNITLLFNGPAGATFSWQVRYRTISDCPDTPNEDPANRRSFVLAVGTAVA